MSNEEQKKVIDQLRTQVVKIEFTENPKTTPKIDKATVWEQAKEAGETISDDTLSTPHPSGS